MSSEPASSRVRSARLTDASADARSAARPEARPDGRTIRAERTRRAIVDALLALTSAGDLKASAERIADRAGVSLRTLWTHFRDLDTLYAAVNERLIEIQQEQFVAVPAHDPLVVRVSAFCEQRGRMLEVVAPAARAAQLRLPFSVQLQRNRAVHHARYLDELVTVFEAELAVAGTDRERLTRALMVNTTWPAWSMLRDDLRLDPTEATMVMTLAVSALLCPGQRTDRDQLAAQA